MLFYTGIQRHANEVLAEQVHRTGGGELDGPLKRMRGQVGEAVMILEGKGELAEFGRLLDEAWQLKRGLSARISTDWLDQVYLKAQGAGAVGGKLLGAGGGGFMLLFAEPDRHPRLRDALAPLREVPFAFEAGGTRLIFND
jgi:D-glycero-alpha-D-manno-heptose-7-phosphate kinase